MLGHTAYPYTSSGTDTWDILQVADADASKPENVILVYSNSSVDGAQEYNGGQGWTREHLFPQSLMRAYADTNDVPATDTHALIPASLSCNAKRNNNRMGTLNGIQPDETCRLACDASAEVCEPADSIKGTPGL